MGKGWKVRVEKKGGESGRHFARWQARCDGAEIGPVASKVLTPEERARRGGKSVVAAKRMTPAKKDDVNESKSPRRDAAATAAAVYGAGA
jgi:hypothetical protein